MRAGTCLACGATFTYRTAGKAAVTCSWPCRRRRQQEQAAVPARRWARRIAVCGAARSGTDDMSGPLRVALYARVSTRDKDQDPELQLEAMREYIRARGGEGGESSRRPPRATSPIGRHGHASSPMSPAGGSTSSWSGSSTGPSDQRSTPWPR